jgi:very-short-patch-repair endonuclease
VPGARPSILVRVKANAGVRPYRDLPETQLEILNRALLRLPEEAVFSCRTAGWIYGLDLPPCSPIDVTVPRGCAVSGRAGIAFHKARLSPAEVAFERGFPITSELRTVVDLARRLPPVEAVAAVDMALHAELVGIDDLSAWVSDHVGEWRITRVRKVARLAEPATESPMETRLRLILVLAGLPRPDPQVSIHDHNGDFVARPDFLYPEARLAIEFDGGVHRDALVEDNRRQNRLLAAGYRVIRFTGPDLHNPGKVVAEVRDALGQDFSREIRRAG